MTKGNKQLIKVIKTWIDHESLNSLQVKTHVRVALCLWSPRKEHPCLHVEQNQARLVLRCFNTELVPFPPEPKEQTEFIQHLSSGYYCYALCMLVHVTGCPLGPRVPAPLHRQGARCCLKVQEAPLGSRSSQSLSLKSSRVDATVSLGELVMVILLKTSDSNSFPAVHLHTHTHTRRKK